MKKVNRSILFFVFAAFLAAVPLLRAQLPKGASAKGFQFVWHDPKDLKSKALFSGATAKQVTGSQLRITDFGMKILRDGQIDQVELIAQAPDCLFDRATSLASSAGPIKAYTPTTNLYIEGVGFFCQQSNGVLIISNQVQTIIHKGVLKSGKTSDEAASSDATNQFLRIYSDHFRFLYDSNLVTYTGNVRVEDSQVKMTCDLLNIILTTNKTVEHITADQNVVIENQKDKSRAKGEQAIYTVNEGREIIQLLGNPVWTDGEREGKADKFVFDRTNNLFRAENNAVFKVPRNKIGNLDLLAPGAAESTNISKDLVVISSDLMTLRMPPTNGPIQEMVADKNVVILSQRDESRAVADRAVYTEATGLLELTGNPEWKFKGNEIKADVLVAGRTNQFFGARTNVHLRIPAALFGKLASASGAGTNTPPLTNQVVEIFADDFAYTTNAARFRSNVRANSMAVDGTKSSLRCDFLDVSFGLSNQVRRVEANGGVFLQQIPPAAALGIQQKSIACELLVMDRSLTTGFLERIHAEKKVVGEQIEQEKSGEVVKRIGAEIVDVRFEVGTNQIDRIVAENHVMAERILKTSVGQKTAQARGERAVYSGAAEVVELTGNPSVMAENILFSQAIALRWNLNTGKIIGSNTPYKVTPIKTTESSIANPLRPTP